MALIDELIESNSRAIKQAVVSVENRRREDARLSPLEEDAIVWLPSGPVADLRLLNWRVWSKRYGVSVEYIFETAALVYSKARRWSRKSGEILFGFSVMQVTGPAMRERLEERMTRDFPNDEHRKIGALRQARPLKAEFSSLEDMVARYGKEMDKRRAAFSKETRPAEKNERNYRKEK